VIIGPKDLPYGDRPLAVVWRTRRWRCGAEVAASHRLSWRTVQRAVDEHTELVLGEPRPTPLLGIDATRFGRVRWVRAGGGRWVRTQPWETGYGFRNRSNYRHRVRLHCTRSTRPRPA
jgi:hypothetical protein